MAWLEHVRVAGVRGGRCHSAAQLAAPGDLCGGAPAAEAAIQITGLK
eukprot:CAMPEP_0116895222 /NCGR_PEP_ID=MMETSP0467-20121206/4801_1 /TAXON_ID=283647 /ORGANISM="Mesodinium pulex, Strain SPMC105" /LENGTH=46 /DNA_ID= /DNA_START= /DNA_END= /DNA_ORIENTATION=